MRKLTSVLGNSQRLDGGAMFGNAPKALWARWVEVDDNNQIPLNCRALLVHDGPRRILLETGIGNFFAPELKARYGVIEDQHVLLAGLQALGLSDADIDIVIFSHLHFDHAGGVLSSWQQDTAPTLLFPNAQFLVGATAWQRACQPHPRDRASFITALNQLLETSGRLHLIDDVGSELLGEGYRFHFSDGHTPGLMLTEITMPAGPVVFAGDLIPGTAWLHAPITMGYDRFPELVVDEKTALLQDLISRQGRLFYTHDAKVALSNVQQDAEGRFVAAERYAELIALAN